MALTFSSSSASKLGNENDNYGKVSESLQHNKKFLWKSKLCSPSGLLYAIYINKHMQTHTCTILYILYINLFYFHHLTRITSLALHFYKDGFDISHLAMCVFLRKTICFPEPPLTQDGVSSFEKVINNAHR